MVKTKWLGIFALLFGITTTSPATAQQAAFERQLLIELNRLRADPSAFAPEIVDTLRRFDGNILRGRSKSEIDIMTSEGAPAVKEAVAALQLAPAVATVAPSRLLGLIARDLVAEQSKSGGIGHQSQGRGPVERALARGGGRWISEVITYGHSDPASVIEQFLVGDGVKDRVHRRTILSDDFRYAGAACGAHPVHRVMCVIMLSPTPDAKVVPFSR